MLKALISSVWLQLMDIIIRIYIPQALHMLLRCLFWTSRDTWRFKFTTSSEPEKTETSELYLSQMCPVFFFSFFFFLQWELSWSYRKTTCPLRLSEDALRNKRLRLGKSLHKWGLGLKESKLQEWSVMANLCQVKRICSPILLHFPGTGTVHYVLLVL